jgi:hypothetical protein
LRPAPEGQTVYKRTERSIFCSSRVEPLPDRVSRHYSDNEWARIVAGVWAAERPGQVRMFMTTKRTMWSSELGREYGWVLCPIRRPSRALVVWLLANLEEQA